MSNEAMKLALEALKNTYALRDDVIEAIKALEEALVADKSAPKQEQQVVSLQCANCQVTIETLNDKVMSLLAKQEHDCTRSHPHEEMSKECELRTEIARLTNQLANTKQEQGSTTCDKPVAWGMKGKDGFIFDVICPAEHEREEGGYTTPLYTTPPSMKCEGPQQRTWVALTDEDIERGCNSSWVDRQAFESAVWWAEAKLKEKNNGT
jgi:hypothetical protein